MARTSNTVSRALLAFVLGVVTLPLLLVGASWLGLFSVRAVDQPPDWEEGLAGMALGSALHRQARGLQSTVADADDTLLAGIKLYRNNCAGCHGDSHAPSPWGAKNFYPRVPQFPLEAPTLTPAEMFLVVKYGIRYSGMGAWNGLMSDDDIWRVVLFLGRLGSLPPAVESAWQKVPSGAS